MIGSPTVLIHGQPAARWMSDTSACGVLLGDIKLVATRTVWIGDFGLGAGPGGTVPEQCAYLGKPFVITAPQPDFDRVRGMYTLSPGTPGKHRFSGDWIFRSDTAVDEAEVKGRKIEIIMPKSGAPAGRYLPTPDQVAMSLAAVPAAQLDTIKEIEVSPNRSPDDAHWEKVYGIKGFTSAASGGNGKVTSIHSPIQWINPMLTANSFTRADTLTRVSFGTIPLRRMHGKMLSKRMHALHLVTQIAHLRKIFPNLWLCIL